MHLTPEALKALFDGNSMLIMLVVGLLYTRLPALKNLANAAVPWLNAGWYILMTYLMPAQAHASVGGSIGSALGFWATIAIAGAKSALASVLYDKFLKEGLDVVLPKAVPGR